MKILDRIAGKFGYSKGLPKQFKRSFSAADLSRLTSDWLAPSTSGDAELRGHIVKMLRNRARQGERDEDYIRAYLRARDNNVIGSNGVHLRVKAETANGQPDEDASDLIEDGWDKWGRKEFCTVTRKLTLNQAASLSLRGQGRDGGSLIRKVRGFPNDWGYAIQVLEIDHLATDLNRISFNGGENEIRFGIEFDQWFAPIAYHLYPRHPGDYKGVIPTQQAVPIRADEILHIYRPERPSYNIGIPELSSVLYPLQILRAYKEAEITAARAAACKAVAITQAVPEGYQGEGDARNLEPVEPGMTMLLNPGETIQELDPKHPVEAFGEFCKSILRSVAAGVGMSYNSLANDLEGVNFSSIRAGLLEEREEWKATQQWFIAEFYEPIFEDWLKWSLMSGMFEGLSIADYERLNHAIWTPRRWPWVDPEKDANAAILEIGARLDSRENKLADLGRDMDEIDEQFKADPVTKDIDSDSVYAPHAKPDPAVVPVNVKKPGSNGNGNGNGNGSGNQDMGGKSIADNLYQRIKLTD